MLFSAGPDAVSWSLSLLSNLLYAASMIYLNITTQYSKRSRIDLNIWTSHLAIPLATWGNILPQQIILSSSLHCNFLQKKYLK